MSRYEIVLAPGAESDVADAYRWYRERNTVAADAFRAALYESIQRIADAPLSRPADDDGNRKRLVNRFPYSVHYEVVESTVTVLAVAHHRRRPNYWRASKPT